MDTLGDSRSARSHRMRPAALRVAAREHVVRGVEENYLRMNSSRVEFRKNLRPLRKEKALAWIDSERDALQRRVASRREQRDAMRQRNRQVVDAVEAEILEHAHRRRASRSRHTGKYYEAGCLRRAHRRAFKMTSAIRLGRSILRVFFLDQFVKLVSVFRRNQMISKRTFLQQTGNPRQCLQMQAGGILGRDQHKEKLRRSAVERIEIDAGYVAAEGADYFANAAQLAVRDRDTVADCGRTQALTLGQHCEQIAERNFLVPGGQQLREFAQYVGLGSALEVRNDHIGAQDIGNFHLVIPVKSKIRSRQRRCVDTCGKVRKSGFLARAQ